LTPVPLSLAKPFSAFPVSRLPTVTGAASAVVAIAKVSIVAIAAVHLIICIFPRIKNSWL
jgi:hypothetical protein